MGTTKKATIEDAWGAIVELAKAQQKTACQLQEIAKQSIESQEKTAKRLREYQEQTAKQLKKLSL